MSRALKRTERGRLQSQKALGICGKGHSVFESFTVHPDTKIHLDLCSHLIKRLMKWKDVSRAKQAGLLGMLPDSTFRFHGNWRGLASFFLSFILEGLSLVTLTLSHWQSEIRNSISPYLVMVGW